MINRQKGLAIGLIACLLALPISDLPVPLGARAPRDPAQTKQEIARYGVGTTVEVAVRGANLPLRGPIQAIEDEFFTMVPAGRTRPTQIKYGDVDRVRYSDKYSYKASGQPDPDQARRVVAGFGTGKHIKVKLTGGSTVVGRIETVEQDHFTVSTSAKGEPVKIAYTEVQQVKRKGIPLWGGIAIAGAVCGGVLLWLTIALSRD